MTAQPASLVPDWRLGTTSFIIPAEILPNVRFLGASMPAIRDIELLLFEVDARNLLPSPAEVDELALLAEQHQLTYTVHLPLDLQLASPGNAGRRSLQKALRVIERMEPVHPFAYVLHVEAADGAAASQDAAASALATLAGAVGAGRRLAVENHQRLGALPIVGAEPGLGRPGNSVPSKTMNTGPARCVDIGHLWLAGEDPAPVLERELARLRVVHLHGVGERDHCALSHIAEAQIQAVVAVLLRARYEGVLTLEVFNQADLIASLQALDAAVASCTAAGSGS